MTLKLAYRGHPALTKAVFVAECRAHREADRLVKGVYKEEGADNFRGCAVGCAVQTIRARTGLRPAYGDHGVYADLVLGGRIELVLLEDRIFEGLPSGMEEFWPERFAEAIPDGADLSGVASAFLARMLREIVLPLVIDDFPVVTFAVERVATGLETGWSEDGPIASVLAADAAADAVEEDYAIEASFAASLAASYAAKASYTIAYGAAIEAVMQTVDASFDADQITFTDVYRRMADILCDCLAAAPVPHGSLGDALEELAVAYAEKIV